MNPRSFLYSQERSGGKKCCTKFLLGQRQQRLHPGERWSWIDEFMATASHQIAIDNVGVGWSDYRQLSNAIEIDSSECVDSPNYIGANQSECFRFFEQAYESSDTNGPLLLSEIPIRRAAGVLSATRKIGVEMSKKVHALYTNSNPNYILWIFNHFHVL